MQHFFPTKLPGETPGPKIKLFQTLRGPVLETPKAVGRRLAVPDPAAPPPRAPLFVRFQERSGPPRPALTTPSGPGAEARCAAYTGVGAWTVRAASMPPSGAGATECRGRAGARAARAPPRPGPGLGPASGRPAPWLQLGRPPVQPPQPEPGGAPRVLCPETPPPPPASWHRAAPVLAGPPRRRVLGFPANPRLGGTLNGRTEFQPVPPRPDSRAPSKHRSTAFSGGRTTNAWLKVVPAWRRWWHPSLCSPPLQERHP